MSTPTNDPLDALIASYVQAIEAGRVPNRQGLLDGNPDHAEALQTFFNDFDRMDRVASPLRMAGDLDETAALDGAGLTQLPTLRYFGDYELLEEIAQGGMGIVYKARQTSLNRVVALKMILAGTFATPREVARFQSEAEAAANLDHPHIVPVHEVGEQEGQQYFSMKFLEGGSLANHPRGEIKLEVLGLITIARAVHHAHQRGVLHRDLKPSNILIDAQGDRHVTDFGLAKRLSDLDRSLTEAGQVLGTPRYMSPEQALGRKDLTVATDIYALGVILYERLTGRTPFVGETALAILRQVRESEPPRPSTFLPNLGRDLETIVLKCLEKDPTRRYPTAEDLVEDLTRWLEGRPINARPVGQAERFARWCRRNPAVAGLSASVAAALLLGAMVSTLFAYQERNARIRAEKAEDRTERAFARSLARPLGPNFDKFESSLSHPEVMSLWELATEASESLRSRFLDESLNDPSTIRQFFFRSEPALVAALGLDPERRKRAVRLLVERLRKPQLPLEVKVQISSLLLAIEDSSTLETEEASIHILRWLGDNPKSPMRVSLEERIFSPCHFLSPSRAATILAAELERTRDPSGLLDPIDRLSTILKSEEAAKIARAMVHLIERTSDSDIRGDLTGALVSLSTRLEPTESERLCGQAARAIKVSLEAETKNNAKSRLTYALQNLSGRLDRDDAEEVGRTLSFSIEGASDTALQIRLAEAMESLSARLRPADASQLCNRAALALANSIERVEEKGVFSMSTVGEKLEILSGRLEPADTIVIARSLADSIERTSDPWTQYGLTPALGAFSARLEPAVASPLCERAARAILTSIDRKNSPVESGQAQALKSLLGQLEPAAAIFIASILANSIERETENSVLSELAEGLAILSGRLEKADSRPLCHRAARAVINSIRRESYPASRTDLASALKSLSSRLEEADVASFALMIADSIERTTDAITQANLAEALTAMSGLLGRADSARLCGRVGWALTLSIERAGEDTSNLADAFPSLSNWFEPAEAAKIAHIVARYIDPEKSDVSRAFLSEAVASLSAALEPAETATIARSIADSIERETNLNAKARLAESLAGLSSRLEPSGEVMISHVARVIADSIERSADQRDRTKLAGALGSLLAQIESDKFAREMVGYLCSRSGAAEYVGPLKRALSSLTPSRRHERANRFALTVLLDGTLAATMREASQPDPCRLTSQELVELLKMPTCYGATRRVVLDQLGHIHGRLFFNHWDFVRFAKEKGLPLDFTSPPHRPAPKASLKRLLDESASGSLRSGEKP